MKYLSKFSIEFWGILALVFMFYNLLFAQYRIMPVGDSITVGVTGSDPIGGFRDDLASKLITEGIIFDFVGDQRDGTGFDADHEGHSGWRADQIVLDIENWLSTYNPHIVLLHVGTNDISQDESSSDIIIDIEGIVDKIYNYNNGIEILCSYLIPRTDSKDNINTDLNHLIQDLIYEKQNANYKIRPIDQNWGFKSNPNWATEYMSDVTHPNNAGYQKMADVYFNGLMNVINQEGSTITDNFNRESLGNDWSADPEFKIVNNELSNTSTSNNWDFLAIFKPGVNPTWVSFKWGINADSVGINNGGLALRLDAPNADEANGYLAWIHDSGAYLWLIEGGVPSYAYKASIPIAIHPKAGDVFKVVMSSDDNGHHFDYVVNEQFVGRLTDPNKHQGNESALYAGAMLRGNNNNNIDNFTIYKEADDIAPAAVTDLRVGNITSSSVKLLWSAPGDDGMIGIASKYDVRYSKSQITEANFSSALLASGIPAPSAPGSTDSMVVAGLLPGETNYFALKTSDEVPNQSTISNVVSASIPMPITVVDDFNRTELGPNWIADPAFKIVSNELANTSTVEKWEFIAIYNARFGPIAASFKYGKAATANDVEASALALMMDAPSVDQSTGYMAWIRTSNKTCNLYEVVNGTTPNRVGNEVPISSPVPKAGDELKVMMSTDADGHHFDFYVNNIFAGRVNDPDKLHGNASELYAGVILHGNRNNNIDDFTLMIPLGEPSILTYKSGNNQTGVVKTTLPQPLVVIVTDQYGNPFPGISVNFTVTQGSGSPPPTVSPANPQTNANGEASTYLTLGTTTGVQKVQASVPGLRGSPVTFTAVATPGLANKIVYDSGNNQSGTVKTALQQPFKVKIVDEFNNAIPNHKVHFKVTSGGGTLDGNSLTEKDVMTDSLGLAQVTLTLGSALGVNTVEASSTRGGNPLTNSPITFTATAVVPKLVYVSGNDQKGAVGMPLNEPFVVKVADENGNGVVGFPVNFEVKQGGGNLNPSGPWYSEANGLVQVTLILGPEPSTTNEVWATAEWEGNPLPGSPIIFQAISGMVTTLTYVAGNGQTGSAGWPLEDSLTVKVTDSYGNTVGGYPVVFSSTEGDNPGTFNGASDHEIQVTTDSKGIAKVLFFCGVKPGIASKAKAIATGLTGSPVNFNASVAELIELKYVSGNGQAGTVGTVLQEALKAKVVDQKGRAIPNYPITFSVIKGGGSFSGDSIIVVNTDYETKIAATTFKLGSTPGDNNNVVEATAVYKGNKLNGSPIRYTASGIIGAVQQLIEVSGNYQSEVVGNPLENPFVVKVADACGNPITNHSVKFTVKTGGGYLDGDSSLTTVTKNSNGNGEVKTILTIGTTSGQNNNSVEVVSHKPGTETHLINSPTTFYASGLASAAHTLVMVSGGNQPISPIRVRLPQPFTVKVTDKDTNPISDHPVQWQVEQGNGSFDGLVDSIKTINTNANGISKVYYYPGPIAGVQNVVSARSWNQFELSGSPITFVVDTKAGPVSAINSVVSATSPFPADGVSKSTITATLMDDYDNKIENKVLSLLQVTGSNNFQTNFYEPTDSNGQAIAYLASTKAEIKVITVRDVTDGINLQDTATVRFKPLAAHGIGYVSGTDQITNYGTAVKNPIQARVFDIHSNSIANHEVFFEAYEGGGYIWESQPIRTDENGIASAHWVLGPSAEVNRARAIAEGLAGSGSVRYIATAKAGTAIAVRKDGGDKQIGIAGLPLNEPLVIKVVDKNDDPIFDYPTKFNVAYGGGSFNGAATKIVRTDPFGQASMIFTLGRVAGSNVVSAEAPELNGSPIAFTEQGIPGEAAKIVNLTGENKTGSANGIISGIQVKVTDIFDNPVSAYTVNFAINKGDATITGSGSVASDAKGIAQVSIRLGSKIGEVELIVAAPGLVGDGLKIKVFIVAATAVSMAYYHGNNQQGTIERELVYPFSVIVRDQYGNPAGGQNVPVSFVVTQGNGVLLDGPTVYADENGIASARFQLGNVTGTNYKVWAINNGLAGSPVEFQAAGVTNKFPIITPISDATIQENQNISFKVSANDDNQDPIRYGAHNLPQGALFDSLGTKQFNWTPNYFQAGTHIVHFMAWDNKGGFDDEPVMITVENVNRVPQITYYEPITTSLVGHLDIGETYRFMVQATDPDNDELTHEWYANSILVSSKNHYDFYVAEKNVGNHSIHVIVCDGYDEVRRDWSVYVKTPVELASFSGHIIERQGVELEWETTVEVGHAGFNVLRKSASEREYQQINELLIKSDGTKKYHYVDRSVEVGEMYSYKLEDVSITGEKTQHDPITVFVTRPKDYKLYQNYPNPFNPTTLIEYQLPDQVRVSIKVYNIIGQEVKTLVDEVKETGYHSVIWNGFDNKDTAVTSGIYYYRLVAGSYVDVKKMVLLR